MNDDPSLRYDRLVEGIGELGESHRWLLDHVPSDSLVLDCGCAGGYLAGPLRRRGCVVDGLELDRTAARKAEAVCRRVFVGSLDDETFMSSLEGRRYDRIVLGDVLEHTAHPGRVLERLRRLLASGGRVLASLPNVAYWHVRWNLLRGRFEYRESGILDRTHLRFFTYETAQDLATGSGFRITELDCTLRLSPILSPAEAPVRAVLRRFPNLFGYQTLLELEPASE